MLALPELERIELAPGPATERLARVEELVSGEARDGYLRARVTAGEVFVFLHHGKAYCAGAFEDGRFVARSLESAISALAGAEDAAFVRTDLPLFLCTAVLFRKAPAAQLPFELVDSESLLRHVREAEKDAVLVVRKGSAHNLVFCREGKPVVLYPAPGERFGPETQSAGVPEQHRPDDGDLQDRILEYGYQSPADVTLDLYHDIGLRPAKDAGKPLASYLVSAPPSAATTPSLMIHLGGRVVFRFPVERPELTVGRGSDNDVPLDNLSVSRRHARIRRDGERLIVEDLGSENGLVVGGNRKTYVELAPGDEVEIGRYTLIYPRWTSSDDVVAPSRRTSVVNDAEETIAIPRAGSRVTLEHAGARHAMKGALFLIGKGKDAHLRVPGLFVGGVHARIKRTKEGFAVERAGGLASLRLNGEKIAVAPLKDGDEIAIGKHVMRFVVTPEK